MMIVQFLPVALVGPLAGVVVDRLDRRRLMIAADVVRGLLILCLLLVRTREQVWLAYVVMGLTMAASAFFEPARTATIPNVTSPRELLPANALASATWSAMLAVGASIGGIVTAVFGQQIAFGVNALSFFVSALFIGRTRYDARPPASDRRPGLLTLTGIPDLMDGLMYVRRNGHIAALMMVKTGWGLAGGVLLLLTIFGQRVFPVAGNTAFGIGVLYGARGVGAALGPAILRAVLGQQPRDLRRTIGPAYFIIAIFYMLLAWAPTLPVGALCVLGAHFGGSVLWVFSTVLLQLEVPDRFRGRVFAVELALTTLASSLSSYWTGYELDRGGWSPRMMSFALGALFCVPGILWLIVEWNWNDVTSARSTLTTEPHAAEPCGAAEEALSELRVRLE